MWNFNLMLMAVILCLIGLSACDQLGSMDDEVIQRNLVQCQVDEKGNVVGYADSVPKDVIKSLEAYGEKQCKPSVFVACRPDVDFKICEQAMLQLYGN